MGNKMLIDATHPEETRVVVMRGNRVEEFDYESAAKKQLRGNIYLAKVTRVEPSLQAAFVNYGGNRHGFLAFNEIHPDYYQLPLAERQALKQEDARARKRALADEDASVAAEAAQDEEEIAAESDPEGSGVEETGDPAPVEASAESHDFAAEEIASPQDVTIALEAALPPAKYSANLYDEAASDQHEPEPEPRTEGEAANSSDEMAALEAAAGDAGDAPLAETEVEVVFETEAEIEVKAADAGASDDAENGDEPAEANGVESVGSEDALEELPERHRRRRRIYKIQEVIKRGQILLVQVVKEERGNKGAALTTYLSLAGRYTVLMPNTASGGGISRKISSPGDRKRLREIADELDVTEGMGLIIRTAGASRTKTEIKRDYEYLLRLWENVRDLTLKSTAPALVYEEGDLIKRSIRDLYSREIDEVLVAGDDAYRDAKDFMRMLMPSHAKNVQPYRDPEPVFTRYEVERQLNGMFSPQVTLPSGGYIVLNQTEALVAIDVNSGKATREFSIEDTALKTNLEAAEEVARQLRLRDLAGLIVVDFIDMEEKRNNRAVERRLKECLRNDRARIQVGHISHFGLLEMSRQRLRTGMIEGSTTQCPHCQGTGFIRSTESVALSVLRGLEDWLRTNPPCSLNALTSVDVALYILNQKRGYLQDIESRYGVLLSVTASERMQGSNFHVEKLAALPPPASISHAITQSDRAMQPLDEEEAGGGEVAEEEAPQKSRRRRRRRGRGESGEARAEYRHSRDDGLERRAEHPVANGATDMGEDVLVQQPSEGEEQEQPRTAEVAGEEAQPRRRSRRRGRRGGRHQRMREQRESGASAEHRDHQELPHEPQQEAEGGVSVLEAFSGGPVHVENQEQPSAEALPEITAPQESQEKQSASAAMEPEPAQASPVKSAETMPVEQAAAADDFRTGEGKRNGNGNGKGNGAHHPEPAADVLAEGGRKDAQPAAETQPETIAKPRGTKRGWWQQRR